MNENGNCAVDVEEFAKKAKFPDWCKYRAMERFAWIPRIKPCFLWLQKVVDIQVEHIEGGWMTLHSFPANEFRNHF
jgi:hypothetical protein